MSLRNQIDVLSLKDILLKDILMSFRKSSCCLF